MENGLNLIMPMGGAGSRFSEQGFLNPKPLLQINGKPFFYWATESIRKFVNIRELIFVVLQEHVNEFSIDKQILSFYPEAKIKIIPKVLNGAVLTCLEGIDIVDNDGPILFNDCDHMFICDKFYDYIKKGEYNDLDAALMTFESNDPKFSFIEYDQKGNIKGTVEKVSVSNSAICGAYYFRNYKIFKEAAEKYLKKCSYKEFFVSGVYNILADEHKIIKDFKVNIHIPFGTPEEYEAAMEKNEFEVLK